MQFGSFVLYIATLCVGLDISHDNSKKTTQQDLESLNLSLNEAVDVAQNRPLWRMMSTFWRYALIVVHARNE